MDEGHSPWQLDGPTVALFYAQAVLGWSDAQVASTEGGTLQITDKASDIRVEVTVGQPSRVGEGGIWAVTSLRSAAGS